jgi:hypothetical protein
LLEYACTFLPAQQEAIVEAVSKAAVKIPEEILKAMSLDPEMFAQDVTTAFDKSSSPPNLATTPILTRFVPLDEIEKALLRQVNSVNVHALATKAAEDALDKLRGRV